VSTPIGNLGDLSPRAVSTLVAADLICCEDTRRTRELLSHAGIRGRRLLSLHGHNEASRIDEVLDRLAAGETIAVVSDAGTPSLSDPGARLVARAVESGFEVSAVPGPNAALTALVTSGLPTDRFCFEGFLPRRGADRKHRLGSLATEPRTVVLYEAPVRVARTLVDLVEACGRDRPVAIARELTKLHEEVWRGSLGEAADTFVDAQVRGEVVIVLGGSFDAGEASDAEVLGSLRRRLAAGNSARDAAAGVAEELGVARRRAYELALSIRHAYGNRHAKGGEEQQGEG
jgi:16S rRNA (cytidine1402-2'-O)-methyltransferase